MGVTLAIARREFKAYFSSPLGFIILILFSFVLGVLVFAWSPFDVPGLFDRQVADLGSLFAPDHLPLLFVLFGSAISMRLWSEERRLGTDELLLTFPVRSIEAVLGKFLGALGLLLLCLLTTTPMIVLVAELVDDARGIDIAPMLGGYFAAIVLGATCLAVGQLASAFTRDQLVAFLVSFVALIIWFFLARIADALPEFLYGVSAIFKQVGLTALFDSVDRGQLLYKNIVLLLSVCGLALGLNALVLSWRKAG